MQQENNDTGFQDDIDFYSLLNVPKTASVRQIER